jgi:transcription termination factor 2
VELLQSIQFGQNQNFEWALSEEDKTKDPNLPAVETLVRLSRLRYLGHVLRMDNSRLPKIMINSEVDAGKRNTGRPKMNYRACIKADLKLFGMWEKSKQSNLSTMASDRQTWRRDINLGACEFQKKWVNHRIANSIKRNQL